MPKRQAESAEELQTWPHCPHCSGLGELRPDQQAAGASAPVRCLDSPGDCPGNLVGRMAPEDAERYRAGKLNELLAEGRTQRLEALEQQLRGQQPPPPAPPRREPSPSDVVAEAVDRQRRARAQLADQQRAELAGLGLTPAEIDQALQAP